MSAAVEQLVAECESLRQQLAACRAELNLEKSSCRVLQAKLRTCEAGRDDFERRAKAGAKYAEMHIALTEKHRQCEAKLAAAVASLAKRSEQLAGMRSQARGLGNLSKALAVAEGAIEDLTAERDRLRAACETVETWLRRLSERATQQAGATEWPSMVDACRAENYGTVARDLRAALEATTPPTERDRLRAACEKVETWLRRLSERATQQAGATEWPSMVDAYRADAKNYGAVARDLRAALRDKS